MAPHVHEALRQVQEIRRRMLGRQMFRGYSGVARISGGVLALAATLVLSNEHFPREPIYHLCGWGAVAVIAFIVNFVALLRWHGQEDNGFHSFEQLRPVIDIVAPLIVGGLMTFGLIRQGQYDLLFGSWMSIFGLANIASHHVLPEPNFYLGWFYLLSGACYLIAPPEGLLLNPWPMGIVFFLGEIIGGAIFLRTRKGEQHEE